MITILIVDDHTMVGEGTKELLMYEPAFSVDVVTCSSKVIELIKERHYDIFIIDLEMPDKNGLVLTTEIISILPKAMVLIYTGHDLAAHYNYFIDVGVSGFISKSYTKHQLIRAVWSAVDGQALVPIDLLSQLRRIENEVQLENGKSICLTMGEEEILIHVYKGMTNDEIAEKLHMSRRNVERYLTRIFKALNVNSRAEAIVKGQELGLIPEVIL